MVNWKTKDIIDQLGSINLDQISGDLEKKNKKIDKMLDDIHECANLIELNDWEETFVDEMFNLRAEGKNLSKDQIRKLTEIYDKHL